MGKISCPQDRAAARELRTGAALPFGGGPGLKDERALHLWILKNTIVKISRIMYNIDDGDDGCAMDIPIPCF